ncbi:Cysteine-rich secretory protein family protein [Hydrogenophaga sp. T4]|nr:Cysteine-rich secretory protein family protein [Hydrogenophaga sp. T4]
MFLAACGGGSDDGGNGDSADVPLSSAPALVQQYAGLFNAARAQSRQCGTVSAPAVAPLTDWNSKLQQAAQKHADDMAKNNFLGHIGSDGSSIDSRTKAFGYTGVTVAENAAGFLGSPQRIMNAWMQSQGHCLGIMAEMARSVALAQSGKYTVMLYGD